MSRIVILADPEVWTAAWAEALHAAGHFVRVAPDAARGAALLEDQVDIVLCATGESNPLTGGGLWVRLVPATSAPQTLASGYHEYLMVPESPSDLVQQVGAILQQAVLPESVGFEGALHVWQQVLDRWLDVICAIDGQGRFLRVSAACHAVWGYTADELVGRRYMDLVLPADHETTRQAAAQVLAGQPTRAFENRYVCKDGSVAHMMWSALWSEDDQLLFCVARNVTEIKATQARLDESQARYRSVVEDTPDLIWSVDVDGRITFVNSASQAVLGVPPEALTGRLWFEVMPPDWLDEKGLALMNLVAPGTFRDHEITTVRPDGTPLVLSLTVRMRQDERGVITGLTGISKDITNRKLGEEQIVAQAELLDKAQDAIVVRDLDHAVLFWNKSAERLYGWPAAEVRGLDIRPLIAGNLEDGQAAFDTVMERGDWTGELRQKTRSGQDLIVESRWTLVRDRDGKPHRVLTINTDITERKLLREQSLRAQRLESIGTLASGIAHDLNNILSPIVLSIEILKAWFSAPEARETLEAVRSSAERGTEMVKQILSFATGVKGQQISVQPATLITEMATMLRDTLPRSIHLESGWSEDVWNIQGDPTQLHQVLLNLCVNARDAMPKGGTLRIRAHNVAIDEQFAAMTRGARPGPYVCLSVHDTGSGMPPDVLSKIFDSFFTTKDLGSGTGLGLSTVQAIATSHQGFVNVYSEMGRGSLFKVFFPAQTSAGTLDASPAESALPRGNGELVMVVDDEASIRIIARQTLEAFGYRVVLAADGAQAVDLYRTCQDKIDIVVTDMMMPVMDGPATIRALSEINPDVIVVAASGLAGAYSDPPAAVRHYLPKPFTAAELLCTLHDILNGHMARPIPVERPPAAAPVPSDLPTDDGPRTTILVVDDEATILTLTSLVLRRRGYHVLTANGGLLAARMAGDFAGRIDLLVTDMHMPDVDGPALAKTMREQRPDLRVLFMSGGIIGTPGPGSLAMQKPYTPETLVEHVQRALIVPLPNDGPGVRYHSS